MKKILVSLLIFLVSCNNSNKSENSLEGRLKDETMILKDDKRLNPNLLSALKKYGMDGEAAKSPVDVNASNEDKLKFVNESEPLYQGLFSAIFSEIDSPSNIIVDTVLINGVNDNTIKLYVSKPNDIEGDIPAILHIHGGGMALMTAGDPNYVFWRNSLAAQGLMVIGVDFRNIGGAMGNHPFPAGLNDCYSALSWIYENKKELGVSKIVISGESGGGNLTIATALKAHQEGASNYVDGVYAQCPYISNMYNKKDEKLASLIENDSYFLDVESMDVMASLYDGANSKNPLAWPYHAEISSLTGLPPHIISVNELDPLRDEGIAYYEMLKQANVSVDLKVIKGTVHASENIFPRQIPIIFNSVMESIKEFSYKL